MVCRRRQPERPTASEMRWAARRIGLAIEAVKRRWGKRPKRYLLALLKTLTDREARNQ